MNWRCPTGDAGKLPLIKTPKPRRRDNEGKMTVNDHDSVSLGIGRMDNTQAANRQERHKGAARMLSDV